MDGLRRGRTPRAVAIDVWGAERVAAEWRDGGWMRSQMRRWTRKAEALAGGGWRELVPRDPPEE